MRYTPALLGLLTVASLAAGAHAADRPSTRTGTFHDFPSFPSTVLNNVRTVTVLLPASYATSPERRYPVLYANDGQNVFDEATAFIGREWKLDETVRDMAADSRIPEIIVVAVYNTKDRMQEYMPGATGDKYVRFLATELKPFIDNRFRTRKGPKDTAILGSSMGALISLWATVTRPDVFGQAAALSPAMQFTQPFEERLGYGSRPAIRAYLDMGTAEVPGEQGRQLAEGFTVAMNRLKSVGWQEGKDFVYYTIEGGKHNEDAWADRLDRPLEFLFSPRTYKP